MKKIFTLILFSMIAFNAIHAEITWTLSDDGTLTISGTDMPDYDIRYDRYAPWISQRDKIKKVVIEKGVTSIGNAAFSYCKGFTSITIPNSVTSIGNYAFYGCSGLSSITIPNSVGWIGTEVFQNCSNLTSVTISMKNITNSTFKGCSNLNSVTISNSVTSIGEAAFADCSGLSSITIPNSVTSIGSSAFSGCSKLTSINIQESVMSIGVNAFEGTIWYDKQPDGLIYIGHILYRYKGYMPANTNIVVKDGTKGIAGAAFYGCSGLSSITIPNSVTNIGDHAFDGAGLASITIPNSVTSIGQSAFDRCYNLSSVTIDMKNIAGSTFKDCRALKNVTIGNSVESIGNNTFYNCYNLQSITITNSNPPSCLGKETFTCSTSYVRDAYDVYNYATLHIPMGSKEAYSSAYEWRYFNNIKEDMEQNGKVFYAQLAVKQGTTGYTEQPVKADETYTIYIGALGENKINAVTFNGEDVTDQVKDGYYTTPAIKAKSTLSISYEESYTTNVKEMSNPELKVTGNEGEINISGIDNPTNVEVYTTDGRLVENQGSVSGDTRIQVKEDELYLVKVGKRTIKIAM